MKREQPFWLDKESYPFTSNWITIEGHDLHYIDEGAGDVIVFVHGTPEWSFGYREVIKQLRSRHRCIAIDLLGFGLSDKPSDADYRCEAHARRLREFIIKMRLSNIALVANDFGGSIGLHYALENPVNVRAIVLSNTWMRSLVNDPHFARPAKVMNSWLGKFLYLSLNFPVRVIMPAAYGNKKLLTRRIHSQYKHALPPRHRHAAYAFAGELMKASPWWQTNWERLGVLSETPFLFLWGMKDAFVPPSELERWAKKIPPATIIRFDDAGHFVHEEKPGEMAENIHAFLGQHVPATHG